MLRDQKTLTLELGNHLATGAIKACRAIGRSAVAAVVDRGGNLIALQRNEDIGPHNIEAARRKAFTALSTKAATRALAERVRVDVTSAHLATVEELLLIGGGLPVVAKGEVVGGIGVAGAGGAANDEACASAAIKGAASSLDD